MDVLAISVPTWLILVTLTFILLYIYGTWTYDVFVKTGIPGPKPWPLIGNSLDIIWMGIVGYDKYLINTYGKIYGIFTLRRPTILVTDVDILRQVMVKEFSHFTNRRINVQRFEAPFNQTLLTLKDGSWKRVRSLMTPAFSSGKLKAMTQQINNCADVLVDCLLEKAQNGNVTIRNLTESFALDVIAGTAFGIDVNSQKNINDPFVKHIKKFISDEPWIFMITLLCPKWLAWLPKYLGLTSIASKSTDFFKHIIKQMVDERMKNKSMQTDFLQLMMNAHDHSPDNADIEEDNKIGFNWDAAAVRKTKGMTVDELTAQCLLFFLAGTDTTASTLSFLCYNLAVYPHIQERVFKEIQEVIGDEKFVTQEMYNKLTYLDQCISETLRIHSLAQRLNRVCKEDITIKGVRFQEGMTVTIPISVIHNDATYWPDPESFNPDRFTPEAKAKRDPMTWIPFGFGPRNCIGMRLAQMELKIAMVKMLQKVQFMVGDQTEMPPLKIKNMAILRPVTPIMLKVQPRISK